MDGLLYLIAAALVVAGLCGAVVPILPGIPLMFGGMWLAAAVDRYRHVGTGGCSSSGWWVRPGWSST
jgi:hypothetical protein